MWKKLSLLLILCFGAPAMADEYNEYTLGGVFEMYTHEDEDVRWLGEYATELSIFTAINAMAIRDCGSLKEDLPSYQECYQLRFRYITDLFEGANYDVSHSFWVWITESMQPSKSAPISFWTAAFVETLIEYDEMYGST